MSDAKARARIRTKALVLGAGLLFASGGAFAQEEREPPFDQGTINVGGALGFGGSNEGFSFLLGANAGYFVLPGLEPGLYADVRFGSNAATVISVLPYLRWIIWRSHTISPYLKVQGGRLFVFDYADFTTIGGGGGFVIGLGNGLGLNIEGLVFRWFPTSGCEVDGCTRFNFGLSLAYMFGGDDGDYD